MSTHTNRVAVVTGAARGIGQAIAQQLGSRGATVVAVDLQDPHETVARIQADGGTAVAHTADVADQGQTQDLGRRVESEFGRCDILVNNAGIYPFVDIDDLDYDSWRRVITVNLDSQFLMTKAVLATMKAGGWGRIVNLTSNSIGMPVPGLTHYMASKMGAIGFTRALANDVAAFGITVNAVGPTLTRTPGVVSAVAPELQEAVAAGQAIKKVGEADDVVGTILFLTSEDSHFVTGQTIMADGGYVRL
ncbi:MAG: SDR family NAD(P)-dependent oxidoreductase [Actinomycetales bacterium]